MWLIGPWIVEELGEGRLAGVAVDGRNGMGYGEDAADEAGTKGRSGEIGGEIGGWREGKRGAVV